MKPHAKSQNSLQLSSAHGHFITDWADLICRTKKPAAICAQLHPQARAKSRVHGHSIKGGLLLHLKDSCSSSGCTLIGAPAINGLDLQYCQPLLNQLDPVHIQFSGNSTHRQYRGAIVTSYTSHPMFTRMCFMFKEGYLCNGAFCSMATTGSCLVSCCCWQFTQGGLQLATHHCIWSSKTSQLSFTLPLGMSVNLD